MATLPERYLGASAEYFAVIGVIVASYFALKVLASVLNGLQTFVLGSPANLRKYGEWAVVTGATDGIGKAYAQELACSGINIVLISRTMEKLEDVATEIRKKYKVETKVLAVDFTGGFEIYEPIRSALQGLEIGTLVNNVGMSYANPSFLLEVEEKNLTDLINCNILSLTMMTRIVMPQMVERRRGVVINVASASATIPTPLLTAYSASKAYVDFFSRGLQTEYKGKGIIIQSQIPFFVATKMSNIRRTSFFTPDPTTYVRQALKTVGTVDRTFGCLAHALQGYVIGSLPTAIAKYVTVQLMLGIRAKAQKRLQKTQ